MMFHYFLRYQVRFTLNISFGDLNDSEVSPEIHFETLSHDFSKNSVMSTNFYYIRLKFKTFLLLPLLFLSLLLLLLSIGYVKDHPKSHWESIYI